MRDDDGWWDPTNPGKVMFSLLGLGWAALILGFVLSGCGATALQTHARAALVVGSTAQATYVVLHDARATELDGCEHAADVRACLDEGEARWAPVVGAYNAVVAAHEAWVGSLEVANMAGEDAVVLDVLLRAAAVALRAYSTMIQALAPFGLEVPDLRPLIGGLGLPVDLDWGSNGGGS